MTFPRALPVGDAAVALEFGDALDAVTNARVRCLDRDLARRPFEGFREAVPTHRSLLVLYDPALTRFSDVARDLRARAAAPAEPMPPGRHHEIPVAYAVTYLVGTTAVVWFLSALAPRLLRVDLRSASRAIEVAHSGKEEPAAGGCFNTRTVRGWLLPFKVSERCSRPAG